MTPQSVPDKRYPGGVKAWPAKAWLDVYGIGEKKTPEAFRMACKRFIYVENLSDEEADTAEISGTEPGAEPRDGAKPAPAPRGRRVTEPAQKAIPLIAAAMRAIDPEGEWYSLGQVGQYITQANPDFDTRTYGSAKLSDLIRKITSRFEVQPGTGGQVMVRDRS